jgi:hypothetical protein
LAEHPLHQQVKADCFDYHLAGHHLHQQSSFTLTSHLTIFRPYPRPNPTELTLLGFLTDHFPHLLDFQEDPFHDSTVTRLKHPYDPYCLRDLTVLGQHLVHCLHFLLNLLLNLFL